MARRYDLYGSRGNRDETRPRKRKKPLSIGRAVKGFFILLALHMGLLAVMIVVNPKAIFAPITALDRPGFRTNACNKVFFFLPDYLETPAVCLTANLLPFFFFPMIVLLYILARLLRLED